MCIIDPIREDGLNKNEIKSNRTNEFIPKKKEIIIRKKIRKRALGFNYQRETVENE